MKTTTWLSLLVFSSLTGLALAQATPPTDASAAPVSAPAPTLVPEAPPTPAPEAQPAAQPFRYADPPLAAPAAPRAPQPELEQQPGELPRVRVTEEEAPPPPDPVWLQRLRGKTVPTPDRLLPKMTEAAPTAQDQASSPSTGQSVRKGLPRRKPVPPALLADRKTYSPYLVLGGLPEGMFSYRLGFGLTPQLPMVESSEVLLLTGLFSLIDGFQAELAWGRPKGRTLVTELRVSQPLTFSIRSTGLVAGMRWGGAQPGSTNTKSSLTVLGGVNFYNALTSGVECLFCESSPDEELTHVRFSTPINGLVVLRPVWAMAGKGKGARYGWLEMALQFHLNALQAHQPDGTDRVTVTPEARSIGVNLGLGTAKLTKRGIMSQLEYGILGQLVPDFAGETLFLGGAQLRASWGGAYYPKRSRPAPIVSP